MSIKRLFPIHALGGFRLSTQAGWNQTLADWKLMLELGRGFGIFEAEELVATTLYLPYPPIAWIGMVLVDERFRRRGLATRLMERCLDGIAREGLYPMLDATETGRQVYQKLGFEAFASITRFKGPSNPSPSIPPMKLSSRHIEDVQALDMASFSGDRSEMVGAWAEGHAASYFLESDTPVRNFGFVRPGRLAWHIGPVIAENIGAQQHIISSLLAGRNGQVIVDVPDNQTLLQTYLNDNGYLKKRMFFRMTTQFTSPLDVRFSSIAGPEWG